MSAARLIGLTVAAAESRDRAALEAAFNDLNTEESEALGAAAGILLEREARLTGNWGPWAEMWSEAGRARLQEAGAGFRQRLDASANAQTEWERRARLAEEQNLRRVVSPLMRRGAAKAEIEERAGKFADSLGWPRVFAILVEELGNTRQLAGVR